MENVEFVFTMEPIDCTVVGTGVADRLGWVTRPLGAGLTVMLVVQDGCEEERGLLSERSTGSVWSSAAHGSGEEGSVLHTAGSNFTFRSVGCEQSSPTSACWRRGTQETFRNMKLINCVSKKKVCVTITL